MHYLIYNSYMFAPKYLSIHNAYFLLRVQAFGWTQINLLFPCSISFAVSSADLIALLGILTEGKRALQCMSKYLNEGSQYHSLWLTEGEAEKERSCPSWFERAGLSSAGSQLLSCACLWKARLALPGGTITACAWVDEIVPALDDASGRVTGCLYSE